MVSNVNLIDLITNDFEDYYKKIYGSEDVDIDPSIKSDFFLAFKAGYMSHANRGVELQEQIIHEIEMSLIDHP